MIKYLMTIVLLAFMSVPSFGACSQMPVEPRPDKPGSALEATHLKQEAFIKSRLASSQYYTIGIGDSIMGMWPNELLEYRWGGPVLNSGRGGSTTSHWLKWLDEWDWSIQEPSVVYINLGRNDLTLGMCPFVVTQQVLKVIDKVKTKWPNVTVVWQNITPGGENLELLDNEIRNTNQAMLNYLVRYPQSFLMVDAWTVIYSRCVTRKVCGLFLEGDKYRYGPIHLGVDAYELINRYGRILP